MWLFYSERTDFCRGNRSLARRHAGTKRRNPTGTRGHLMTTCATTMYPIHAPIAATVTAINTSLKYNRMALGKDRKGIRQRAGEVKSGERGAPRTAPRLRVASPGLQLRLEGVQCASYLVWLACFR